MIHPISNWKEWATSGTVLLVALIAARIAHKLLFSAGKRLARRTGSVIDNSLVRHMHRPSKLILPLLAPAVIFRAGAVSAALDGLASGAMWLLAAFSFAAVLLSPFAAAASVRLNLAG